MWAAVYEHLIMIRISLPSAWVFAVTYWCSRYAKKSEQRRRPSIYVTLKSRCELTKFSKQRRLIITLCLVVSLFYLIYCRQNLSLLKQTFNPPWQLNIFSLWLCILVTSKGCVNWALIGSVFICQGPDFRNCVRFS